jgi:DNA primase
MAPAHERRAHWDIAEVLDRTDLADLLDELTQPAGRLGPGRRWHCPMRDHDDLHASVTMFRDRHGHERWRCWSADHRGDALDLVAITQGTDRGDALDWLATRAGMVPDRPLPPVTRRRSPAPAPAAVLSPLVERYVHLCHSVLRGPQGAEVRQWLHGRGIDDATIDANRLGADPGRHVLRRARGLPYGAGLAAVLPAFDPAGRLTYVQSRYLDPDATGRKYDNPAAALAPHPRLAFPVATGERAGVLLVCEGLPDALVAAQAGYRSAALLGAHTPDASVAARLANHAANLGVDIAIVADADPAGRHVADTLTALLGDVGVEPVVIVPPVGGDLNGWALSDADWLPTFDRHVRAGPGGDRTVTSTPHANAVATVHYSGSRCHRRTPPRRHGLSWKEPS